MTKTGSSQSRRDRCQCLRQSTLARLIVARTLTANQFLHKGPCQLDRIEIGRIGRQVQQSASRSGNQLFDIASLMNAGIIHNNNRTWCQSAQKLLRQEVLEVLALHRPQLSLGADHPQAVKSTDHREVFTALRRHFLDQILSFLSPSVQQAKSQRDSHFIQKHQIIGVKRLYLLPELVSFLCVSLQSDFAFFLKLKRICLSTRVAVDMERLASPCACQASASASAVQSFLERTSASKAANLSSGTRRFLPGVGFGCRLSPSRFLVDNLSTLEAETANLSAIASWLAPVSRASIMRCRRSWESGLILAGYLSRYTFDEDYSTTFSIHSIML